MDFDSVFERLYSPLHRYLQRLTGDLDTADDVAQEAFVRLLRNPLPEEEAKPWLFTVATNLVRDQARKVERRARLLEARPVLPSALPGPAETFEREAERAEVRRALDRLSERDRRILLMREEGFKYDEIARVIDVAPGSVGTLLARALRRFQDAYHAGEAGHDARGRR